MSGRATDGLRVGWADNFLTVSGPEVPGGEVKIWYIEAYCRPGSTDREWGETTIGHRTEVVAADPAGKWLRLRCTLGDGVVVDHSIRARDDEIDFRAVAHNPTDRDSAVSWAQPCIRVDRFTGRKQADYLEKCFIVLDGKLRRMPVEPWATKARYMPGQVWRSPAADPDDVNPRPVSEIVPREGLIGCFSADERTILASAWEPYQELFQGVIVCVHADFRIDGLKAGARKRIRGKLYIVPADEGALLARYRRDFPEQGERRRRAASESDSSPSRRIGRQSLPGRALRGGAWEREVNVAIAPREQRRCSISRSEMATLENAPWETATVDQFTSVRSGRRCLR
jgi:hypothetical protein